jgi:glycine/D-amino acid oxidase-like deaminating enzyme
MAPPWPTTAPTAAECAAFADAERRPFWQQTCLPRATHKPLRRPVRTQLCIVGGGFTGLWAALYAKELDPERDVTLLEATRCGDGASSRNGGFIEASLTHGLSNGLRRFPAEIGQLEALGEANLEALAADLRRYRIDAGLDRVGVISVALEPHELGELEQEAALGRRFGYEVELLDAERTRSLVSSPTYLGGAWQWTRAGLVNPARLLDGLLAVAVRLGVRIHEYSPVRGLERTDAGVRAWTDGGLLDADRVLLATSAYPPLVRAVRRFVAPVYDYVLVTEPLGDIRRASIGWGGGQGVTDTGNQFHYYRPTADGRILWGGYDAVYRYGGPVGPHLDSDDRTFARLSQHFFTTFPQLEGVRFTHAWGGAIDTCSRFSVFFGHALARRAVYALGYTGLGVGASRFGGRTALDLLDGRATDATRLELVRRRPVPFPPEPLRSAVIQLTRHQLAAADRHEGRRGLWLRALDRAGLGFDS